MADKRVKRTTDNIFDALLQLACEKDVRKISVKDLCTCAGVNKSTFYLHFTDLTDCRSQLIQNQVNRLFKVAKMDDTSFMDMMENPHILIERVLMFFESNFFTYKKLFESPFYGIYITEFKATTTVTIAEAYGLDLNANYTELVAISYIMGGIIDSIFSSVKRYDHDALLKILPNLLKSSVQFMIDALSAHILRSFSLTDVPHFNYEKDE